MSTIRFVFIIGFLSTFSMPRWRINTQKSIEYVFFPKFEDTEKVCFVFTENLLASYRTYIWWHSSVLFLHSPCPGINTLSFKILIVSVPKRDFRTFHLLGRQERKRGGKVNHTYVLMLFKVIAACLHSHSGKWMM